jgi:hypothetical protein
MIRNFILLAIGLFLTINLSGQQKSVIRSGSRIQYESNKDRPALKSTTVYKQKMDSIVWQDYSAANGWFISEKDSFKYDAEGKLYLAFWYNNFYTGDGQFIWLKDTLSYYANGKQNMIITFARKVETEPWRLEIKTVTFYDAHGNDTLNLNSGLDSLNREQFKSKELKTFDSGENLLTSTIYDWSVVRNAWVPASKSENDYDNLGNMILTLDYEWDNALNNWIFLKKHTYIFDSKSDLTEDFLFNWSSVTSAWIPETKYTYSYDSYGFESLSLGYSYDPAGEAWINDYRIEMEFDEFGNLMHHQELGSKDSTGEWTYKFKVDYRFNHAYYQYEIVLPFVWIGKVPPNQYLGCSGWIWDNIKKEWVDWFKGEYYYSAFAGSGIDPINLNQPILVYPNPVNDFIAVEAGTYATSVLFELSDITGKQVISKTLNGARNQVSVSELPDGLYLYRIIRNGETYQGKVIKR